MSLGGIPRDDALAAEWFQKAAEQGDASGQKALGKLYEKGRGVVQDTDLANAWYRKANQQDEA